MSDQIKQPSKDDILSSIQETQKVLDAMPSDTRAQMMRNMTVTSFGKIPISSRTYIYVELSSIIDLTIGSLMYLISNNKQEYGKYMDDILDIVSNSDEYRKRLSNDLSINISSIEHLQKEIDDLIKYQSNEIIYHAPFTDMLEFIRGFIDKLEYTPSNDPDFKTDSMIHLTINTHGVIDHYDKEYFEILKMVLKSKLNISKIEIINDKATNEYFTDKKSINKYLMFVIESYKDLINRQNVLDMMQSGEDEKFVESLMSTYLFSSGAVFTKDEIAKLGNNYNEIEKNLELYTQYINAFINFDIVNTCPLLIDS